MSPISLGGGGGGGGAGSDLKGLRGVTFTGAADRGTDVLTPSFTYGQGASVPAPFEVVENRIVLPAGMWLAPWRAQVIDGDETTDPSSPTWLDFSFGAAEPDSNYDGGAFGQLGKNTHFAATAIFVSNGASSVGVSCGLQTREIWCNLCMMYMGSATAFTPI